LGRHKEEIACYDKVLQVHPNYHIVWNNRGIALMYLARFDEAIASYDKAIALQPNYYPAWYSKACCYALQGHVELAIKSLQEAIELNPEKCIETAKTDSYFGGIRKDKRFQALLQN